MSTPLKPIGDSFDEDAEDAATELIQSWHGFNDLRDEPTGSTDPGTDEGVTLDPDPTAAAQPAETVTGTPGEWAIAAVAGVVALISVGIAAGVLLL